MVGSDMLNDRKSIDAAVIEKWGPGAAADLAATSFDGALLALKYGPNWPNLADRAEVEKARFFNGDLFFFRADRQPPTS